jgi:hypothetical protein
MVMIVLLYGQYYKTKLCCEPLVSVVNYDRKCDATIWSVPWNTIYDYKTFIVQAPHRVGTIRLPYFIEYNVHTRKVCT